MAGVKFDQQSARRIADATRKIERLSVDLTGRNPRIVFDNGWVPYFNAGSQAVPAWGVVRVNSDVAVQAGDTHSAILQCERPTTTFTRTYAVNSSEEVPAGGYGLCRLPPWNNVEVLYDTDDEPELGQGWGPKPDSFRLFQYYPQTATIISVLSGLEGSETVLCNWQELTAGIGKANGTIANRASGAFSVWAGTDGSEVDITGMDPTGFNRSIALASGDWVQWIYLNGQLQIGKLCS